MLIETKDLRAEKSRTFKTTLRFSVNYVFNAKVPAVLKAIINAYANSVF